MVRLPKMVLLAKLDGCSPREENGEVLIRHGDGTSCLAVLMLMVY